jgi:hypothetical protein
LTSDPSYRSIGEKQKRIALSDRHFERDEVPADRGSLVLGSSFSSMLDTKMARRARKRCTAKQIQRKNSVRRRKAVM